MDQFYNLYVVALQNNTTSTPVVALQNNTTSTPVVALQNNTTSTTVVALQNNTTSMWSRYKITQPLRGGGGGFL